MANAQVEKLKALGLRHGEKAVVGLSAGLCLLFLVSAVMLPTIELTPDQVKASAQAANTNLERRQDPDDILKRLEDEGIKNPGFETVVDAQSKQSLDPLAFQAARPWITPEPGAGLIRDRPELLAPTDLYAYPGRGGALVWALDEDGKRILDDPKKVVDESTTARRKKKRRRNMMGSMGGGSGMMGGSGGMMGMGGMSGMGGMMGGPPPDSPEAKKEAERKERQLKKLLAGKEGAPKEKDKEKDETETTVEGPFKEVTKGVRWVAITGVLDHKKMLANYLAALKNPTIAQPNYKQVDIQRQVRGSEGDWGAWEDVDLDENHKITFNLPEEEEELTPDDVRINTLVDPLPFLKAGLWEKVHVVSLVPKEKREIAKAPGGGGMMGPGGMMSGGSGMMGMMGSGMGGGSRGMMGPGGMMSGGSGMMSGGSGMMSGGSGMMGMMGGGGMGAGGGAKNTDFQKSDADTLMIRALDFTVEPDTTYRFRLRIAVFNPNYNREDVSPGVDTKSLELKGPWSEPTNEVTMPADVTAYAMSKIHTPNAKRNDVVRFQVVRWNPEDGVTVTRNMEYGPGQIVGEPMSTPVPNSDGEKAKNKNIDYNTHQILLDNAGGPESIAQVGVSGAPLDVPATSLFLRPDGSVVLRSEVKDTTDPVRKDISENYSRELKESGKKRENSMGSGMMGMGSGMMGMGGMGGAR